MYEVITLSRFQKQMVHLKNSVKEENTKYKVWYAIPEPMLFQRLLTKILMLNVFIWIRNGRQNIFLHSGSHSNIVQAIRFKSEPLTSG